MIRLKFTVIGILVMAANSVVLGMQNGKNLCGVPKIVSERIHFGEIFTRGSFPWIVALMLKGVDQPGFFCGGTMISNKFVVSGNFLDFIR